MTDISNNLNNIVDVDQISNKLNNNISSQQQKSDLNILNVVKSSYTKSSHSQAVKNLPFLVQEVLEEQNSDFNKNLDSECDVKKIIKEYIRNARNLQNNRNNQQIEQNISNKNICMHCFEDDVKAEKEDIIKNWFDTFIEQFEKDQKIPKIGKDKIFKRFIKYILSIPQNDPLIEGLSAYIKDNNLLSSTRVISDYFKSNKYMALKQKKKEKLKKDDIKQLNLQPSSSDSSLDDRDQNIQKIQNLELQCPDIKINSINTEEKTQQQDEIIFDYSKEIVINNLMYENFFSRLFETNETGNLINQPLTNIQQNLKNESLKKQFEESLISSLVNTIKNLKELKNNLNKKNIQKQRRITAQSNLEEEDTKKQDQNVEQLKNIFQNDLQSNIDDLEKRKTKLQSRINQNKEKKQTINIYQETSSSIQHNQIQIYNRIHDQQIFYQNAKKLIDHPSSKCQKKNPVLMNFNNNCIQNNIMQKPLILDLINNNCFKIKEQNLSKDQCLSVCEAIKEGQRLKIAEMTIKKLIIDNSIMDNETMMILLQTMLLQKELSQIILRNCKISQECVKVLIQIIGSRHSNKNIEEFKLSKVKFINSQADSTFQIFDKLANINKIKKFQVSQIDINHQRIIESLSNLIINNNNLQELDLSYGNFTLKTFDQILISLLENQSIQYLSLKGISILFTPENNQIQHEAYMNKYKPKQGNRMVRQTPQAYKLKLVSEIVPKLNNFISNSTQILHLDLSFLELEDKIQDLIFAIKSNQNLISVHLSGNKISKQVYMNICQELNIDYDDIKNINNQSTPQKNFDYYSQCLLDKSKEGITEKQIINQQLELKSEQNQQINSSQQSQLEKILKNEIIKKIKNEIEQNSEYNNIPTQSFSDELVIQRKQANKELIFIDTLQDHPQDPTKYFHRSKINDQKWFIRTKDQDCYVCQKYQYVKIFYRRCTADKDLNLVKGEERIQQLRNILNNEVYINDPNVNKDDLYFNLPLIICPTLFDSGIQSRRMMSVIYQASIVWAYKKTQNLIKEQQDQQFQKYFEGINLIMKKDTEKIEYDDITEMDIHFQKDWRFNLMIPQEQKNKNFLNNLPLFDQDYPNEDDIYIYTGYLKPGIHNLVIYDPKNDLFFEKQYFVVIPNQKIENDNK